ncbi:hypothetical protein VTH82DRAFT_1495 [Thermothelomyces myriococcoides]
MAQQQSPSRTVGRDDAEGKRGNIHWVWFITGPTACGKTTIAKYLADKLGMSFVEGDDFHPKANRDKMAHDEPLTDEDRAAWLEALHDRVLVAAGGSGSTGPDPDGNKGTPATSRSSHRVVACSALKRQHRDALRGRPPVEVRFVFLDVDEEVLRWRARERKGHFAGEGLVKSQMETLERPGDDEEDLIVVKVEDRMDAEETEREVLKRVKHEMELE